MIVIVAGPSDIHARTVAELIVKVGKTVRIVDLSRFGTDAYLNWSVDGQAIATGTGQSDPIDFEKVETVWYRRPRTSMIAEQVPDRFVRSFCREEWLNLIEGLFLYSPARFVNPLAAEFAAVKPVQLRAARNSGLLVPDTLITNDPKNAADFIARHNGRVVHKALTAPKNKMIDTKLWDEKDRNALQTLYLAPVIFQEAIAGPSDIRATYIGGEILAARIGTRNGKAGIDSRLDLDAPYEAIRLPDDLIRKLNAFMKSLNLSYGTIDLKFTDAGEYVFFEVNPQGQFLYVELLTGLPISEAMASFLSNSPTE